MKQELYDRIESYKAELCAISDDIYDHPEIGLQEQHASAVLTEYLEKQDFQVERLQELLSLAQLLLQLVHLHLYGLF